APYAPRRLPLVPPLVAVSLEGDATTRPADGADPPTTLVPAGAAAAPAGSAFGPGPAIGGAAFGSTSSFTVTAVFSPSAMRIVFGSARNPVATASTRCSPGSTGCDIPTRTAGTGAPSSFT